MGDMIETDIAESLCATGARRRADSRLRVRRALAAPVVAIAIVAGWGGVAAATTGASLQAASGGISLTSSSSIESCLKAHGVSLPKNFKNFSSKNFKPPKGFKPPTGTTFKSSKNFKPSKSFKPSKEQKKLEAAFKACGVHGGFFFGAPPSNGGAAASAVHAYLGCLSDHGVKVPSKDLHSHTLPNLSSDPKFAAANKVCSVLLPATSTTTTAGS